MSHTAEIIWKSVGVSIVLAILIAATVWGCMMRPSEAPCASLEYIIEDRADRLYLTEAELTSELQSKGLYPVGVSQNILSLHRIEQTILRHPMVRTAECYLTPRQEMKIRLTQRVPLLRVQMPGETYLIDTDRRVMESRVAVTDSVLTVKGAVGVQMAAGSLADFAKWLQRNAYWREKIAYVGVQSPQMIYLYMKEDRTRVVLGRMSGYERKLKKLRTFYENSPEEIKAKSYTELDIRFKGQVIGRK